MRNVLNVETRWMDDVQSNNQKKKKVMLRSWSCDSCHSKQRILLQKLKSQLFYHKKTKTKQTKPFVNPSEIPSLVVPHSKGS